MASFLVDEDLPRSVAARLRTRGIDIVHAVDCGLRGASDARVLAAAVAQDRTVVTGDKEFGNAMKYPPQRHAGVVLVRIPEDVDPELRLARICDTLAALVVDDLRGAIVVIDSRRVRVRRASE